MSRAQELLENVTIVMLSYNRNSELKKNLPELCKMSRATGVLLIIVDNCSTDGSGDTIREITSIYKNVRCIFNQKNLGVAGGRNTGLRNANSKYVLFIDDETVISIDAILALRKILSSNPDIGAVSPRILYPASQEAQNDHGIYQCEVGNFHGACYMVSKQAVMAVGYFDPICAFGGEELDYSIRLYAAGYRVLYTPKTTVIHNCVTRIGDEGRHRRKLWIFNFVRIHFKYFPPSLAIQLSVRLCISHLVSGARRFGFWFAVGIPFRAAAGAICGHRSRIDIPNRIVEMYRNPLLQPDLGNEWIITKVRRVLRRTMKK